MIEVVNMGRLAQLKALLSVLAGKIDSDPGARDMAQISRQYRETLKEIDELEAQADKDDEIDEIVRSVNTQRFASDGEPIE